MRAQSGLKHEIGMGHEIHNFGRPSLPHNYYILSSCDLCLGMEKIFKETLHIHYMTYMLTLAQEPLPRVSWNLQFW